jgi:tRNA(adenine34) deaminase
MFHDRDIFWMQRALLLAQEAKRQDEVPVGAVVVLDDQVIGEGYNSPITRHDPTAHAEIIALRNAAEKTGNYRLLNTTLYVTLEPCIMCAGAMVHARIKRLVYGADDPKTGVIRSQAKFLEFPFINHRFECLGNELSSECGDLLSSFFRDKR